ncbi:hypothetical protein [Streptomyces sp. NPDC004435]|uniref:hypothetical protein n=1 Tax=Streptomyces sp. NPDC004435 TaxID=3364701 RepID=UPI00367559B9
MLALPQADAILLRLTMDDLDAVLSDSVIRVYEEYSEGGEWTLAPLLPALLIAEAGADRAAQPAHGRR